VWGGLFVLRKGRNQGRNEYGCVQEDLHGRWGCGCERGEVTLPTRKFLRGAGHVPRADLEVVLRRRNSRL
jgi:hypothetical protein